MDNCRFNHLLFLESIFSDYIMMMRTEYSFIVFVHLLGYSDMITSGVHFTTTAAFCDE